MAEFHRAYDLVVSPTLATPRLGVLRTDNHDLEAYRRELVAFMPFTQVFNPSPGLRPTFRSASCSARLLAARRHYSGWRVSSRRRDLGFIAFHMRRDDDGAGGKSAGPGGIAAHSFANKALAK